MESPLTLTSPISMSFFYSRKKNGDKERRRSARGRWGKRASTREADLSGPLTSYGLHLVTYSIVGQPLLEPRSGQTQTFPLSLAFVFSPSFFLYAQEKGPKRTAPFGTGPVFPRIAAAEISSVGALLTNRAKMGNSAERINAEKPPTPPPAA